MSRVRSLEVSLLGQRDAHRHAEDRREMERAERERTDPMSLASEVRARRPDVQTAQMVPPILRVNLFGGMVITMGEAPVSTSRLNRQKSKTLLAVLVLNHGREVSHERLAELLWPGSTPKSARKNFYSVWSNLRTTLSVKGFEGCPYLIRDANGCRIDVRFVTSDVYEFDTLCRSLLFGRADAAKWETFFSRLCEEFSEELLPGERENELVCAVRARYSTQLVDALVAASTRLISENETQGALWFAREALRRDARREDVYAALMKAQLAAGQRSAAIGTYFQCREYLAEELGIDPSMRLVDLYRKAIEEEEVFV